MTFQKANSVLGLPNGVKLFPFVLMCFQCFTNAQLSALYEIHVISLTGGLRGNAITKRPHNLCFFISKLRILLFSLSFSGPVLLL